MWSCSEQMSHFESTSTWIKSPLWIKSRLCGSVSSVVWNVSWCVSQLVMEDGGETEERKSLGSIYRGSSYSQLLLDKTVVSSWHLTTLHGYRDTACGQKELWLVSLCFQTLVEFVESENNMKESSVICYFSPTHISTASLTLNTENKQHSVIKSFQLSSESKLTFLWVRSNTVNQGLHLDICSAKTAVHASAITMHFSLDPWARLHFPLALTWHLYLWSDLSMCIKAHLNQYLLPEMSWSRSIN